MNNKALYVGSFDPITNGHLWVIEQASKLFDNLTVAVANNPNKKSLFNIERRKYFIEQSVRGYKGIQVEILPNIFHIDYAKNIEAKYLIRGIRNPIDLEQETQILRFNEKKQPDILPVFLMPPKDLSDLSSSLVKSVILVNGWEDVIGDMVPLSVIEEICNSKIRSIYSIIEEFVKDFNVAFQSNLSYNTLTNAIRYHFLDDDRYYHDLNHLVNCYKWLKVFNCLDKLTLEDNLILIASILFHDIIYEVGNEPGYNETESAKIAYEFFKDHNEKFAALVKQTILATDYRIDSDDLVLYSSHLEKRRLRYIIRDLDLAGLASDYDTFTNNTLKVLIEYIYKGDYRPSEVLEGRLKFLKDFDARNIFITSNFKDKLEAKAHENIQREIRDQKEIQELLQKTIKDIKK